VHKVVTLGSVLTCINKYMRGCKSNCTKMQYDCYSNRVSDHIPKCVTLNFKHNYNTKTHNETKMQIQTAGLNLLVG